jgi:hypothetical protein
VFYEFAYQPVEVRLGKMHVNELQRHSFAKQKPAPGKVLRFWLDFIGDFAYMKTCFMVSKESQLDLNRLGRDLKNGRIQLRKREARIGTLDACT